MAKRYELRIDGDEFLAMQRRAQEAGAPSVAEYLRMLHRQRDTDLTIVDVLSRTSNPKVT